MLINTIYILALASLVLLLVHATLELVPIVVEVDAQMLETMFRILQLMHLLNKCYLDKAKSREDESNEKTTTKQAPTQDKT